MPEHDQAPAAAVVFGVSDPEQHLDAAPLMALIGLPRTRPAVSGARRWLADTLTAWNVSGEQLDDAVLALSEVLTNSIEHAAGDQPATITAALWHGHLRITVSDPDPETRPADDDDEHGRGLLIVRALTTRYGVTRTAAGKVVWFEQLLTAPGPVMTGTCCECGHTSGCGCDCCPYDLPAVAGVEQLVGGA
jgi:anti-sigma regulatory factor (Ser/Thr protein kinase)